MDGDASARRAEEAADREVLRREAIRVCTLSSKGRREKWGGCSWAQRSKGSKTGRRGDLGHVRPREPELELGLAVSGSPGRDKRGVIKSVIEKRSGKGKDSPKRKGKVCRAGKMGVKTERALGGSDTIGRHG